MGVKRWIFLAIIIAVLVPKTSLSEKPGDLSSPEFTENKGQWPNQVLYKLKVANNDLYFEKGMFTYNLFDQHFFEHEGEQHQHYEDVLNSHSYKAKFVGANPNSRVLGRDVYPHYRNYFLGNDESKWASNVNSYKEIEYEGIYDGINMKVYGYEDHLKYDFIVAPQANPDLIKIKYEGLDNLFLSNGDLHAQTSVGDVIEKKPYAYQVVDGKKREVKCEFNLRKGVVSFKLLEGYDKALPLIIDPTLVFSTYTGSTANNFGVTATYDNQGNLYSGSTAFSTGYPVTTGAFQTAFGGGTIDMAISKFNSVGNALIYSTYIGGTSSDVPQSLVVNHNNELVILGSTSSQDYPVTGNAYDTTFNGGVPVNYVGFGFAFTPGADITLTVMSQAGDALVGATYLGGSGNDGVNQANGQLAYNYGDPLRGEVIVNDLNEIFIVSSTLSNDFPVTQGCFQNTLLGSQDACVAKLSANVSSLIWATYVGGSSADAGYSLKLASNGSVYGCGGTMSGNFPTTSGVLHPDTTGLGNIVANGYVFNLSSDGTSLLNSTYLGTQGYDQVFFIDLDGGDNVYVFGQSLGVYPIVNVNYSIPNAKQFIHRMTPDLGTTLYSTTFGDTVSSGNINISPTAFLVDICGQVYVSGWGGLTNTANGMGPNLGSTSNMPITSNAFQSTTDGSDFYFAVFGRDIDSLVYATYFGGSGVNEHVDGGTSRFDKNGIIYQAVCAGCGGSNAFPTTPGAFSNINGSSCNLGAIKFAFDIIGVDVNILTDPYIVVCAPYQVQFIGQQTNAYDFFWDFGDGDTSHLLNPIHTYTDTGLYNVTFIGVDSVTCIDTTFWDTAYAVVNATFYEVNVDVTTNDVQTCPNIPVQLQAISPTAGSFSWTPATGLNNPNIDDPLANVSTSTTYVVLVTDTPGCFGTDTVRINIADPPDVTNDTTICEGDCVQLSALSASGIYFWSPGASLNDSTIMDPVACPSATTTYTVSSPVLDSNLVVNGDFEQGNVGFNSDMTYSSDLGPESRFYIDSNATPYRPGWSGYDHTNPPTGNFFFSNGPTNSSTNVWCQTLSVVPNTDYHLSMWASIVSPSNPAVFQILINGQIVGTHNAPNQTGVWNQFTQIWNSGSNTIANVCIRDINTNVIGNDFGLDDIVFAAYCEVTSQVTITVNPGATINAGPDTAICEGGSVQLTASGGNSYSWTPTTGLNNPNIANPIATPSATTTYYVSVVDVTQCTSIDSVTITVNPNPVANAGVDVVICEGDTTQLGASGGDTYSWTPITSLDNPFAQNPNAFPLITTDYTVIVTTSAGCSDTDDVRVDVLPAPAISTGPDTLICLGDTIQLAATGGVSYVWSPATGLSNPNIASPLAFPDSSITYYVSGTDVNNCSTSDSIRITIFQVVASNDTLICAGDTAQLNAVGGVTWSWTPAGSLDNPNSQSPLAFPSSTTDYIVEASISTGCVASDTVTVSVQALPVANAGGDVEICRGNSAQLNATGGVFYSWSPTFGLDNPNISNPVATPNDTIIYVVTVSDSIGCSDSDSITIFVNPPPVPDAGADTAICVGESAQLQASGGRIYTWSPTTGLSNPNIANPVATPNTTTTYTVNVQAPSGQQFINADFEQGNTGFNTGYNYNTPTTLVPGQYTITTNANTANPAYQGNMDHTTGSGNFMVVNGQFTTNTSVWCQTVNVAPNTDYYIGVWVNTLNNGDPALLQFTADGTPTGSPFLAPPFGLNNWFEYYNVWNSGNNTTVTICLQNLTTTTGPTGFGIDDLVFGPLCEDNDQVTVTVNPLPQVDAGQDENICLGESAQLQATGADSYNWSPTTFLNNTSVSNPVSTPLSATSITYTVTGTDTNGCVNSDQVTVTASTPPTATVSPNTFVCEGQSTTLTASGGSSYSWSPSTGLSSTNTASTEASPTTTTTYTVIVSDQNSCDDTTQVTVTVYPLPTADAGADIELCYGEVAQLTATGGTSYSWTPANYLSNANVANPQATPTEDITYTVTVTDIHGCQNQDSVNIAVFRVTAGPDSSLCMGDSIQLFVSGGTSFQWSPATGLSNPNISNPLASPTETTIYTVTAMDGNGCEDEAELTLQILAAPIAGFMMEFLPSCEGIMGYFENTSEDGVSYIWDFGDGTTAEVAEPNHLFQVGPGGVVTLLVFNGEGCADTLTIDSSSVIYDNQNFEVLVPNVFTPNSDGKNDCFLPSFDGAFNDCFEMQVFNRWGALLFESIAQGDCWDGRNKAGKMMEEGTYYYIVDVNGRKWAGFVQLLY